jgi:hypothetical protein
LERLDLSGNPCLGRGASRIADMITASRTLKS